MNAIHRRLVRSTLTSPSSIRRSRRLSNLEATNRLSLKPFQFRSFAAKSGEDHHAFFQEQMMELEQERKGFFGDDVDQEDDNTATDSMDAQEQHAFFAEEMEQLNRERKDFFGESTPNASFDNATSPPPSNENVSTSSNEMTLEGLDKLHQEREAIFEFSDQEKQAWGQPGAVGKRLSPQLMMEIAEARAARERGKVVQSSSSAEERMSPTTEEPLHHPSFSHVSQDGDSVHMVDVGHKDVTTRMAEAQTKVILPGSVMEAFGLLDENNKAAVQQQKELIGPKGPILATAKLAGIMAAKKNE